MASRACNTRPCSSTFWSWWLYSRECAVNLNFRRCRLWPLVLEFLGRLVLCNHPVIRKPSFMRPASVWSSDLGKSGTRSKAVKSSECDLPYDCMIDLFCWSCGEPFSGTYEGAYEWSVLGSVSGMVLSMLYVCRRRPRGNQLLLLGPIVLGVSSSIRPCSISLHKASWLRSRVAVILIWVCFYSQLPSR